MDVSSVSLQQAGPQTDAALSMLKKNVEADQAIVNVIQKSIRSSPTGGRGNNLDVTV
jgi:hypothetical protein